MPIASPEKYAEMIDAAKNGAFAYPAINVTSSQTLNAAIRGFAEAGSDGIIQVSTGAETLEENLRIGRELLARTHANKQILEVEIGVVGGEEDGVAHEINEKLYTTVADGIATVEALGLGEHGRYLTALTFGNVHGVYKPGNVKLRPEILQEIQQAVGEKFGKERPFDLVFHGGSGSAAQEIADSVEYGVVKMNVDTDTQYAFTRPVAGHMFENYDGVLKVDGEVGDKKQYDPRVWGAKAEEAMAARVVQACTELNSAGKSIG